MNKLADQTAHLLVALQCEKKVSSKFAHKARDTVLFTQQNLTVSFISR